MTSSKELTDSTHSVSICLSGPKIVCSDRADRLHTPDTTGWGERQRPGAPYPDNMLPSWRDDVTTWREGRRGGTLCCVNTSTLTCQSDWFWEELRTLEDTKLCLCLPPARLSKVNEEMSDVLEKTGSLSFTRPNTSQIRERERVELWSELWQHLK